MATKNLGGLALATTLALLIGCSDEPASSKSTQAANSNQGACLLEAADTPCQILTIERTKAIFPMAAEPLEIEEKATRQSSRCEISWVGGRKNTVGSGDFTMEVEVKDTLALSNIRETTPERFTQQHRTMTAEEKARVAEKAETAVADKVADGSIDKEHEQMGKDFAKSLINKVEWEQVSGVGDAAAFGGIGRFKTLDVRVGNTQFSVRAEMSDDQTKVREASVIAAQALIDSCD